MQILMNGARLFVLKVFSSCNVDAISQARARQLSFAPGIFSSPELTVLELLRGARTVFINMLAEDTLHIEDNAHPKLDDYAYCNLTGLRITCIHRIS